MRDTAYFWIACALIVAATIGWAWFMLISLSVLLGPGA